jgi:large exoprotein involved in heme utilization and adhesion
MGLVDPSRQITTGCNASQGSSFVVTGRGGVPDDPTQTLRRDRTWADVRDLSTFQGQSSSPSSILSSSPPLEANAIRCNPNGTIALVAIGTTVFSQSGTCAQLSTLAK